MVISDLGFGRQKAQVCKRVGMRARKGVVNGEQIRVAATASDATSIVRCACSMTLCGAAKLRYELRQNLQLYDPWPGALLSARFNATSESTRLPIHLLVKPRRSMSLGLKGQRTLQRAVLRQASHIVLGRCLPRCLVNFFPSLASE